MNYKVLFTNPQGQVIFVFECDRLLVNFNGKTNEEKVGFLIAELSGLAQLSGLPDETDLFDRSTKSKADINTGRKTA